MRYTSTETPPRIEPLPPTSARTRLGTVVRRAKWPVLLLWIILAVVATPLADKLGDVERNDAAAYLPRGLDSSKVAQLAEPDPDRPGAETAVIVFSRGSGSLDDADVRAARGVRTDATASGPAGVGRPSDVQVSEDGKAALFTVDIQPVHEDDDIVADAVAGLRENIESALAEAHRPGLDVHVAGEAAIDVDNDGGDVDAALMLTSMVIVAILLLLTYRSPVLWLIPLIGSVLAVQVARGAAYGLAKAGLSVTDISSAILIVLVFGAATDYALLLLNRYREELARYEDKHEAIAEALRRTTPALVASAGTVTAGLLCLMIADLAGLRGLGPIAASGVVVALAAMLTVLPALLVCCGRWLLWPRAPRPGREQGASDHRVWRGIAAFVGRLPHFAAIAVTLLLAGAATGLTSLSSSADPLDKVPPNSESVTGQRVLQDHFPSGVSAPLTVVLPTSADSTDVQRAVTTAKAVDGVAAAAPDDPLQGRRTLSVELSMDPYGDEARSTIKALRTELRQQNGDILVGGTPAVQTDYQDAALEDTKRIVPLVLDAVTIILGLLLRSIVAPLMLMATVVLSFAGSLGLSALVFDHVFDFGGVAGDMFIYIFVFLVALGVDYNIFLMERIREERAHGTTRTAVLKGLTATGGVITAAGLVLAGTFSALAQLPDVTVAEVGIAVGIGVLVDTLLVRSFQVPALVLLLGDRVWWPSRHKGTSAAAPANSGQTSTTSTEIPSDFT
ncbi:MMPL family transporter [Streptomyces sp. SID9727]|uniref:MMPL family transporter n=1 Tax=Streptomyces sp. SID9727 TaxID=2706114 RepID=UPI0013C6FD6E|nr:MMPL family transporter [Streptomyces sp. SID9727]NEC68482.1 MMPL family transporter [Streptomyces sp. SID9727]